MIATTDLRRWHAYIGLFIAPSVLFFCLTGAIQLFNLHEAHGSYRPAVLIEKLSATHKDQVFEAPRERPEPTHAADAPPADDEDQIGASTLALKWFFLIVAVGLFLSTVVGIWMGITQIRNKKIAWTLLVTGTLIPIGLLVI